MATSKPVLFVSRNPNPRLAAASARFIDAPVAIEFAAPLAPGEDTRFRPLNPTLLLPILQEQNGSLWECDAVVCRLAIMIGSDFWPTGDRMPDLIRWISWGKENFVRGCDLVQFELGTKRRYNLGPSDAEKIEEGTAMFRASARLLDTELSGRDWLLGDTPTYADFRMATFVPFNDVMQLPIENYPALAVWVARLEAIDAWRDPFEDLTIPALPPISG